MTKILKHYMTRTAVNSPSNPVSQKVFNDMLYAASADVYQMAKKEQHTPLERKTLANYYARSIYRTTPFGLFSAVEFHNRDSETNKERNAVQYLVKPIIKSEATYKITTFLSKTHFKELRLFKNDNALEKSGDTLLNVFPIVDKRKDVIEKSIDDNFLILQILEKIGDDGITFNSLITDFRGIFPEYLLTKIISILIDSHFVLTELEDEQAYTDPNVLINKIDSLGIKVPLFVKDYFSFKEMTLEEFSTRAAEDVNQWFYSQFGTKKAVSYLLEAEASQRYDSAEYDNKILRFCNFLNKHAALLPSAEFESDYMWIVDHYGSAKIPLSSLRERIFEDAFLNEHISKNASNAISRKIRSNYQKYIKANKIPLKELFRDVENTDTDSLVDPTFQLCFNISQSGTLQLSPAIGTRGIGSIEGRFSRINPKEFREIIIQKNKYLEELGVTPVSVKLLNVPRFFSLTSDIVDSSDLELSINLIGTGRDVVKLDELYVQAINGQILIFRKRRSDFELIKVEANNMANWRKIYPPIIQKMFLWSERYFRNVLFPIDIIIKEQKEKAHNPAVFFEDILLLCENWNPIIEIGEGLDRKSFTSKIKNFIKKYSIPKKVALVSGDQHILVSLNELGISQLWSEYKKIGAFTLENNPMFLEISSKNERDNSTNLTEYILNIVNSTNNGSEEKAYSQYVFTNDEIVAENLVWTEYDIYLPKKHQDNFICSAFDMIRNSLSISKTFFIKYFDQRSHIRLRVQATEQQKEKLWFWLLKCYRNNVICDVVIRLYIPETSRYGAGSQLKRIHEFFCQDSGEIVENVLAEEMSRDEKLQVALLLLLDIIRASSTTQLDEIPVVNNKLLKKNKHIWREDWDRIKANISDSPLTDRSVEKKSAPRFRALKAYFDNFNSTNNIDKLFAIQSLIHMTINRVYGIKAEEEGELNYFLSKIIAKYRFKQK